jgi:hypothetical protein
MDQCGHPSPPAHAPARHRTLEAEQSFCFGVCADLRTAPGEGRRPTLSTGWALIASSYSSLARAVRAAHGGAVLAGKVNAAVAMDKRGRVLLHRGLGLLR